MIGRQNRKSRSSERGVALIIALLTLLLISAILMGMIVASNSETNISANFRDEQTAFFAARAGIEEVRDRMRAGANPTLATSTYFTAGPPIGTTPLAGATNVAGWGIVKDKQGRPLGAPEHLVGGATLIVIENITH